MSKWQLGQPPLDILMDGTEILPLSKQSMGVLLPAYSIIAYGKQIRRLIKNKMVFYEGLRWKSLR